MERRCGDPALQLDIDELILDYLIYSATKEIINDYGRRGELLKDVNTGSKADTLLQLVDSEQSNSRSHCSLFAND